MVSLEQGRALVWASAAVAGHVDVLEPVVVEPLRRGLFFRSRHISMTSNSFVDSDMYRPKHKRNLLVFCGLFHPEKQAHRLAAALPTVVARLAEADVRDVAFAFCGRDASDARLADAVCDLKLSIPVSVGYEPNPGGLLAEAKVFFSLQRTTNYPSKSLLEAMSSGCVPIVTDVGSTRRIATDDFAQFVPKDFTPEQVASAATTILTFDAATFDRYSSAARAFAMTRFSVEAMASYYENIYSSLVEQ